MSKKIPRFLYHLTTQWNYKAMVRSGKMMPHNEELAGMSIFMFDLENYFKNWKLVKSFQNNKSKNIQQDLIDFANKDGNLVLIRIPTKNLNPEMLRIRRQQQAHYEAKRLEKLHDETGSEYWHTRNERMCTENKDLQELPDKEISERLSNWSKQYEKQHPCPELEDIVQEYGKPEYTHGEPAKYRRLYEQRKEAMEYIYPEDVTTAQFEKIGECAPNQSLPDTFTALLKGTPEEKWLLFLNG